MLMYTPLILCGLLLMGPIGTTVAAAEGGPGPARRAAGLVLAEIARRDPNAAGVLAPIAAGLKRGELDVEQALQLVRLAREAGAFTPRRRPDARADVAPRSRRADQVPADAAGDPDEDLPAPLGPDALRSVFDPPPAPPEPSAEPPLAEGIEPLVPEDAPMAIEGLEAKVVMVAEGNLILNKGYQDGVREQQRFRIVRDDRLVVQVVVALVRADRCICGIVADTWSDELETKTVEEGDRAELVD